ncbi:GntR family transcriptional regulator [Marinococcus sp. PL1-022]|uniref:GntR family transcriptional regulator n=1 Tax=Marinococcus sp. PL1-022 TaxID=3095363 RepID=UPI0029C1A6FB|nr:GntR family transcriptional regulator [Marinococcus sp. PL1-022]MDX6152626.1 GntR family transcriptional regulator [Marinococcus sp. PL1-022]
MNQPLNLNKDAPPLYIQVKNDLKGKIEEGHWVPGDKITSELDLCEQYQVSRTTVRDAINELVWEKFLIRKRARGTFVLDYKERSVDKDYYTYIKSYTYELNELGQTAKTYQVSLQKIKATEKLADKLNIRVGDEVVELIRVRGSENRHPAYFKTYWQYKEEFSLNPEDYYGSFYELLNEKWIVLENIQEYLEAIIPDEEVTGALNISQETPVLKRVRQARNENYTFIEYTECFYVGEDYRYYIELTKGK